eukprot:TRINITY_DN124_c0_g1_i1.p1 TRINITY_DN124_c0_g1~~TRINITY_DN124_c0_g1_i1.p1  ORF type:complete len:462 (-),score=72.98 TRINITY_DN124_c0_g1_i1:22-1407(-)
MQEDNTKKEAKTEPKKENNSGTNKKEGGKKTEKKEKKIPKISHKNFDLDQYIGNYSGHTRLARLIFIGERCEEHGLSALKQAISELLTTPNTTVYKELVQKYGEMLNIQKDQSFIDNAEKKSHHQIERLEVELNQYKTSLIKESIRMAYNDLGDNHYERGDLNSALKCYVRTRDYCTTSSHIITMCLNVIKVSIEMGNFAHVINYVNKAEQTPEMKDEVVKAKLKCCSGLANLEGRKYKLAANRFLNTSFSLGSNFKEVIAPRDVAIYGGLCALATFDRRDLKKNVLDNSTFKNYLDLVPQLRELLQDFYNSRYDSCLQYLDNIKNDLLLDIHLHDHVNGLYQQIRNKALIQYFSPFVSVDMTTMAKAFNTEVAGLEKELSALILEGAIQARIDSHNKILYARQTNQRSTTFEKALRMGEQYQTETRAMLLRVSMMKNDFVIHQTRRDRDERGGKGSKGGD